MLDLFSKYKLPYALTYDTRHRQWLGAQRSFEFSYVSQDIFIVTFDSQALKLTRCPKCSSTDHGLSDCPFRNAGQASDLPKARRPASDKSASDKSNEPCFQFNQGKCRAGAKCPRKHRCFVCGGPEGAFACPKCNKTQKATANSST